MKGSLTFSVLSFAALASFGCGGNNATGTTTSTALTVPGGLMAACESPWTIRLLAYDPTPVVPRRMYFASCTTPAGTPRLYVSATLTSSTVVSASENGLAGNSGVVFTADLQGSSLVQSGAPRQLPECSEMHGIAAKSDCSVIGVLCRRPTYASKNGAPTKDMVAAITDTAARNWLTQPVSADGKTTSDEEWLYEWPTGDLSAAPKTYVASKAIGSWEYGRQELVYGEKDNSYGLSLKSTVYGPDGNQRHEGDALLIVDRSNYSINLGRGWTWGCASGHTLFNHLAYNPANSRYAVTCGSDLGLDPNPGGFAGIWVHAEKGTSKGVQNAPFWQSLNFGGGPTSLLPLDDGGYLGVIAGASTAFGPGTNFRASGPVSSIGLARYDQDGNLVGSIKWLVDNSGTFYSYPQLVSLGNGTFLLGYGEMVTLAEQQAAMAANMNIDDSFRIPGAFHVRQVDQSGTPLGPDQTLTNAGWGEQDQLVPLGPGRVGWAYLPSPARANNKSPACLSSSLQLSVYAKD